MRKILVALLVLAAGAASAAMTADVTMAEDGILLFAHARVHGIEAGKTVAVTFRWTAPAKRFVSSLYTPSKKLGDDTSKALCFCEDTGEKGCNRTKATRTIEYNNVDGKHVRAVGIWKCDLLDENGVVLGSATYEVK